MTIFSKIVRILTHLNDSLIKLIRLINKNKYHKLSVPDNIKEAKSGSLLLIKNSLILRPFLGYTHVAMIYTYNDIQYVVTAEPIPSCEVIDINKYFETLYNDISVVDLYEIQPPYDKLIEDNIDELHKFVINEIDNKPYEENGMEFIQSSYHSNKTNNLNTLFCSELVVYLAQKFNIPIAGLPDNYVPDDLSKMTNIWKKKINQ